MFRDTQTDQLLKNLTFGFKSNYQKCNNCKRKLINAIIVLINSVIIIKLNFDNLILKKILSNIHSKKKLRSKKVLSFFKQLKVIIINLFDYVLQRFIKVEITV